MESLEKQPNRFEGPDAQKAIEQEGGVLEKFRKAANAKTRILALAFTVLSSEGCTGLAWYGLDPIDRIQRSTYEKEPYKITQGSYEYHRWELRRGQEVVYTLTIQPTNYMLTLEGQGLRETVRLKKSLFSRTPPYPECHVEVKVFGANFLVRKSDIGSKQSPLEIVSMDRYQRWDSKARVIESFEVCP